MKLNENDRFDEFLLGNKDMHKLEFALTKILKKKYDWINSIKLKVVVQDREFQNNYLYFGGMISVDENWAKQIWEKTQVTDFPGNEGYNYENYDGLSLHEFLSRDIIDILSNDFTQITKGVVLFKKDIVFSKIGNLLVYFEDNNKEETLKETIKRVLKQQTELKERCWKGYTQKGMKTMFGKRYPNCVKKTKK